TELYIKSVKENIKETVQPTMMEEVHRQLDTAKISQEADEEALFDKLFSIIIKESHNYNKLVFNIAQMCYTISLLSLPELMGVWIEVILNKRGKTQETYTQLLHDGEPQEDPIFDVLSKRQERFKHARDIMLDGEQTGFIFVLNPERLPIIETSNAIDMLDQYHLHVKTLIVNRVLPENGEGQFFKQRKDQEAMYLEEIKTKFKNQDLIYVPFFAHDITS